MYRFLFFHTQIGGNPMKKKFSAIMLLSIFAFSFILTTPIISNAFGENFPDLGKNKRIEFLDYIINIIKDNQTRNNLAKHLLFNGKVAYFTVESSQFVKQTGFYENFYGLIYTGINNATHRIYLRTNASLIVNQLNFTQYAYVNIILWDNDMSLIAFLVNLSTAIEEKKGVKINELLYRFAHKCETVFTGDEVIIICPVFLWKFDYDIIYRIANHYLIDVNDNGPYDEIGTINDMNFTQLAKSYPIEGIKLVEKASGNPALQLLMNDAEGAKRGSHSNFFYLIQQFWLKKMYFNKQGTDFTYDIDLISIRHMLFRVALYNDTNQNGLMDIAFNQSSKGNYYPYSIEAICTLELVNASSIIFRTPIIDSTPGSESIKWNATIKAAFVRLNPFGQSSETGMLIKAPIVPVGDTSFGFTFRPKVLMSEGGKTIDLRGLLKIDQTFGGLNESGGGLKGSYNGLDLAVIYLSDVLELTAQTKISGSVPQTNATAEDENNKTISATIKKTTSATKSLDFFIGSNRITAIDLAGAKYSIDNEDPMNPTHIATGAVIPYGLYQHTVDQTGEIMSQRGNVNWNLSAKVTYSTYLYEICYPDYDSTEVENDPTYTILGTVTYPSGGIPGFEFYGIFLSFSIVSCIVLFLKKKKRMPIFNFFSFFLLAEAIDPLIC